MAVLKILKSLKAAARLRSIHMRDKGRSLFSDRRRDKCMGAFELPHSHGEKNADTMHGKLSEDHRFRGVSEVIKQLGDPTRLKIFWLLCHYEECVINIAALLDMSSAAVSHHLRSLYDSGLIVSRRDGREVYYKAADKEECELLHKMVEKMMEIVCPAMEVDYSESTREIIRSIHLYLTEHLAERITIKDLSKRFLMNPTTLKNEFKAVYGVSLAAHMKEHRMERAEELLRNTDCSIGEIALMVGYTSQSRFSAAFKSEYGVLPSAYRREATAAT